eukprot:scaffold12816_cov65-Cyclotella_meneghiniana.AAC.4
MVQIEEKLQDNQHCLHQEGEFHNMNKILQSSTSIYGECFLMKSPYKSFQVQGIRFDTTSYVCAVPTELLSQVLNKGIIPLKEIFRLELILM